MIDGEEKGRGNWERNRWERLCSFQADQKQRREKVRSGWLEVWGTRVKKIVKGIG